MLVDKLMSSSTQKQYGKEVSTYEGAALTMLFVYYGFSEGLFSALVTLSSGLQLLAVVFLVLQLRALNSSQGISPATLQLMAVATAMRLVVNLSFSGYLPVDSTGDIVYPVLDAAALATLLTLLRETKRRRCCEDEAMDVGIKGVLAVVAGCAIMAVAVHPVMVNRRKWYGSTLDVMWAMSCYVDAAAMLPQLQLLTRRFSAGLSSYVEPRTCHFVVAAFVGAICKLGFWATAYPQLNRRQSWGGYGVILAQVLQVVVCADFVYYYGRALLKNTRMVLPSMSNVRV